MAAKEFVITSLVFVMVCCFSKVYGQQGNTAIYCARLKSVAKKIIIVKLCIENFHRNVCKLAPAEGHV